MDDHDLLIAPDPTTVASNVDTDRYTDVSEGPLSGSESAEECLPLLEEGEEEEFDDAHSTLGIVRGLSPVAEVSPQAGMLESELDTALFRLSTLTDELTEVEESIVKSKQTKLSLTPKLTPGKSLPIIPSKVYSLHILSVE